MKWLNENSRKFLENGYLLPDVTPEKRIREIADKAEEILKKDGFPDKFYGYMSEGFYSLASPIWSNFGYKRGLPISCFGSYISDDMGSILYTQAEVGMMSKLGGGCSAYFGEIRARGAAIKNEGNASGAVHFMELFETLISVVSQGSVRRGHLSPYLPIEHGDVEEFLKIGTEGHPIQKLTHGVTVGDEWMQSMIDGDEEKRALWAKVIQARNEVGYPYIMFTDNANKNTVDVYKDKGHKIYASNMCSEIMLPSSDEWSFVCCLSSMNLALYDKWKNTDAVETLTYFLDAVMQDFIDKLEIFKNSEEREDRDRYEFMKRAYKFAKENRALGLGSLGWHSLLQSRMLPFESEEAKYVTKTDFQLSSEMGIKGFPSVVIKLGKQFYMIANGYREVADLEEVYKNIQKEAIK